MELEDDETYGGCGNKIADKVENPEEIEQQQGMALENTTVEIVESVNFQESQQYGFEDRTVPIEKLPWTENYIENSDARKVGDLNVLSGKETGMASQEVALLCADEINDASGKDSREVSDNIVLGHSLRDTEMKIEGTASLMCPSIRGNTDGRASDSVVNLPPACPGQSTIVHEVAAKLQMEGGELDSGDGESMYKFSEAFI